MFHLQRSRTGRVYIFFKMQQRHFIKVNKCWINGQWVKAKSGKTMEVTSPVDGRLLTTIPDMALEDVNLALNAAADAFKSWQWTLAKDRSQILRRWNELIHRDYELLTKIVTAESGKPLRESRAELAYGCAYLGWFADSARHIYGEMVPGPWKGKQIIMSRQPIGVISIISPWNFPFAMIARKIGAVLASGCTCVIKPAEDTPLSALATLKLLDEVGIPDGVVNITTCSRNNAASVGKLLCQSDLVAGISFTGSGKIGKILYQQCSLGIKRMALELGGNAPFIIFKTANIDNAVKAAIACKFRNNGQSCVCLNKLVIQVDVFDEFMSKLVETMRSTLIMGDTMNENITVGPLINDTQVNNTIGLVEDAVKKGAKIVTGGKIAKEFGDKYFYPTLLTNITRAMRVYREEIFGPIAPCIKFVTEEEALEISNDTSEGLASYLFSNDLTQVQRIIPQLQFGMVGVNSGIISAPEPAFGGIGQAGIGREGGKQGFNEFTYHKCTLMSRLDS